MPSEYVVRPGRRWWHVSGVRLGLGVGVWWLLIGAGVALTLPDPVAAVPTHASQLVAASTAHVYLPGQVSAYPRLPIPVQRVAFDEAQRGYRESDEALIEHAYTAYEWIEVSAGQAVQIITRDGEAVEVELLEGRYQGRRGWLTARQITP